MRTRPRDYETQWVPYFISETKEFVIQWTPYTLLLIYQAVLWVTVPANPGWGLQAIARIIANSLVLAGALTFTQIYYPRLRHRLK